MNVRIHGIGHRELVLFWDGQIVLVRHVDGRMLWWDNHETYSFVAPNGDIAIFHGAEDGVVLPDDIGAEAIAMRTIDDLQEWAGANILGSPSDRPLLLRDSERREFIAWLDDESAMIDRVCAATAPDEPMLRVSARVTGPRQDRWFEPRHLSGAEMPRLW